MPQFVPTSRLEMTRGLKHYRQTQPDKYMRFLLEHERTITRLASMRIAGELYEMRQRQGYWRWLKSITPTSPPSLGTSTMRFSTIATQEPRAIDMLTLVSLSTFLLRRDRLDRGAATSSLSSSDNAYLVFIELLAVKNALNGHHTGFSLLTMQSMGGLQNATLSPDQELSVYTNIYNSLRPDIDKELSRLNKLVSGQPRKLK